MNFGRTFMLAAAGIACCLTLNGSLAAQAKKVKCPVTGEEFIPTATTKTVSVNGQTLSFCCDSCAPAFAANPEKFVSSAGKCPVMKSGPAKAEAKGRVVVNNDLYYTCCAGCPEAFKANPGKFVTEFRDPVTHATFKPTASTPRIEKSGQVYLFANADSKTAFEKDSAKYMTVYK
jgi:YHS domain-containing protein